MFMSRCDNISQYCSPLVVKLGGSLYEHIPELVTTLKQSPRPLLIIPGGGRFADNVRASELPDEEAHWEAIAAMDTYGRYLSIFGFDATDHLSIPAKTIVFLPYRSMRYYDPLPHSWDVTSDTIAAWVAGRLGLDLVVLKSVDGIRIGGTLSLAISQPLETDVVDPCFIPYVLQNGIRTIIINGSVPETVIKFLRGDPVPGTRISTTF
jgi:5-(aminomethyl)-3-furanmethanol phosphate kinase